MSNNWNPGGAPPPGQPFGGGNNFAYMFRQMQERLSKCEAYMANQSEWSAGTSRQLAELTGMAEGLSRIQIGQGVGGGPRNGPMARVWGSDSVVSINEIPGKCIPFELSVDILFNQGEIAMKTGSKQVNTDGIFVAVGRAITFRSMATFTVQGGQASANGRSFGRFRGVSSADEVFDAVKAFEQPNNFQPTFAGAAALGGNVVPVYNPLAVNQFSLDPTNINPAFPGTGRPYVASPSNGSPYRTMGFDGLIAYQTLGSNFRRQQDPDGTPSHVWNQIREFGCFDVLEPTDTVQFQVKMLHPLNPEAGNINALGVPNDDYSYDDTTGQAANNPMPVGVYPFLASQYDGHEGINDESRIGDIADGTVDRVTRNYTGVLTIVLWGYKILRGTQVGA